MCTGRDRWEKKRLIAAHLVTFLDLFPLPLLATCSSSRVKYSTWSENFEERKGIRALNFVKLFGENKKHSKNRIKYTYSYSPTHPPTPNNFLFLYVPNRKSRPIPLICIRVVSRAGDALFEHHIDCQPSAVTLLVTASSWLRP